MLKRPQKILHGVQQRQWVNYTDSVTPVLRPLTPYISMTPLTFDSILYPTISLLTLTKPLLVAMKAFAILVLSCAIIVAVESVRHKRHSANGPVYDGLESILDDAHDHAQLIADDLTERLNQTFSSIKEKVEKLKDNNGFTQQIEALKVQGDDVQKCLKEHELGIAQFMRKLVNTYESCSAEVKEEVNSMVEKIKEHVTAIKDAPKEIDGISIECVAPEGKSPAASVLCVVTRVAEVKEAIFEANQDVDKFINHGAEAVQAYAAEKCDGIADLKKEFNSLYAKIDTCVKKAE